MRSKVFRHNREVASTFALSRLHTGTGGFSTDARFPASRTTRSISSTVYGSVSRAFPSPSSSFLSPKYMPPVSSRMMLKLVPRTMSALRGDASTSDSEAKKQGRRFPKVPSSLRSFKMPCSGRTFPVPHFCAPCQCLARSKARLRSAYGTSNSAENNGVSCLGRCQRLVGERIVVGID